MHQFRLNLILVNYQGSLILFFLLKRLVTLMLRLGFHSLFHKFEQIMSNLIFDFIGRKLWNKSDQAEWEGQGTFLFLDVLYYDAWSPF